MKLEAGKIVRITPDSPFAPTFNGHVSQDGSRLILPPGIPFTFSQGWSGYKSAEGPPTDEGDPTYTRWDFDPDGTGILWECLECHIVYRFVWGYEV